MRQVNFVVYSTETGEVLRSGSCMEIDMENQARGEAEAVLEGVGGDLTHFVEHGKLKRRPILPKFDKAQIRADGKDEAVCRDLPKGTKIFIDDEEYPTGDLKVARISTDIPGVYRVRLKCWPYMEYEEFIRAY